MIEFRSASLQFLWGMVNTLQLIVHIPLFSLNFPMNVNLLFQIMFDITNFSFINTEKIEKKMFNFTSS